MPASGDSDWRDASAYASLLRADRSVIAWEWLRRNPAYRAAAEGWLDAASTEPCGEAAEWGLVAFEPPHRAAPAARPMWRSDMCPLVLHASAEAPGLADDIFDLELIGVRARILKAPAGGEHVLLSDGLRAVRIDIVAGSVAQGPVQLRYLLTGFRTAERPLLTLRRLLALCRTGGFSRALHRPEVRARRWVLMLRAWDASAAGASQRDIADALLGGGAADPRWRVRAPSLRAQAQRLVRGARIMVERGYLTLLG